MKNITYGLLGLLLMLTSVGQAQTYDVGITNIINPANGSTIQATAQPLIFTVKNFGSALLASDTVWLSIKVDGVTLPINAPRPVAAFASGDSNNLQINLPQFASFTPGSHTICVKTSLTSKTDAVTSNDEFCSTFTVVLPDLGVSAVEIITPAKNDGDTIRTNETVSSIRVTVQNNGAQPYITTPIAIVLDINGSTQNLSLPLNAAIPAGGTVAGNIPSNLIPAQPTSVGSYKVCAYTALTNDADNTNDTNCVTLVVLDPATPAPTITSFAPPKGAVGTDVTINGTGFSATAANNTVKFNGTVATVKSATATQIVATVPTGATTGKVTVEVASKTATSATDFEVTTTGGGGGGGGGGGTTAVFNPATELNQVFYSNGNLHLKLMDITNDNETIHVTDITGRVVLTETVATGSESLVDVSSLISGTYIVTVSDKAFKFSK